MDIIGKKNFFLIFSGILILVSGGAFGLWGLAQGIDFRGGSLLEVRFSDIRPSPDDIRGALAPFDIGNFSVQPTGEKGMLLRFRDVGEETHQEILSRLRLMPQAGTVEELRFDAIGPVVGKELRNRSLVAIVLALVAIMLYVAFAFRKVSLPVPSWKYGVAAILTLAHDILIPVGVFAYLGKFYGVEVDALFITALLTVMGFSVHDKIVVFDRIRENLRRLKTPEPYAVTVNRSMNQTIGRSVNTSFTVLLVLLAIYFFGGSTTAYFALALMIGIVFGTYSSIFVASPLLVIWNDFARK